MWVPRELEQIAPQAAIRRVFNLEEALEGADVIVVLRVQTERLHEPALSASDYVLLYQLNGERLRRAKGDAIVLHPGPMNRGIEISPEVADGPQSCVLDQVTNGIAVRMALLFLLCAGHDEEGTPSNEPQQPSNRRNTDASLDILLDGERIGEVVPAGKISSSNDFEVFDAGGLIVAPGFIDLHAHLREPGQESSETIETGAKAAARGGFTAVCCMPNTKPVNDNASVTRFILDRAKASASVRVWPI